MTDRNGTRDTSKVARRGASRRGPGAGGSRQGEGASGKPLCTRVSEDARKIIEEAARRRGWNASRLLRVGAIEKATEILNLEGGVAFDFDGLARDVAACLLESFQARGPAESGAFAVADPSREGFEELVEQLDAACRFGGRGFLEMIVRRCRVLCGKAPDDSREPLDPGHFL